MPLKTAMDLAMEHFDFYYKPIFGSRWPSIRLGLLSPNKYICIVNRFNDRFDTNIAYLERLGSFDLIDRLAKFGHKKPLSRTDYSAETSETSDSVHDSNENQVADDVRMC